MSSCYVDTSALLKRFVHEAGATEFDAFVTQFEGDLVISPLGLTEFVSALQRRVRMAEITADYARQAYMQLLEEVSAGAWTMEAFDPMTFSQATQLITTLSKPLATLDAIHLAIALQLGRRTGVPMLATGDKQLATAAQSAALTVHYVSRTVQ
jgi:predicted nucleic acid-binding protein